MQKPYRIELFGGLRILAGDRVITRFQTQKTGALRGYYGGWSGPEQQRRAGQFLQACRGWMAEREQAGDLENAIAAARHAVRADSLREEVQRDLIRLLAASGHPHEALRQFRAL